MKRKPSKIPHYDSNQATLSLRDYRWPPQQYYPLNHDSREHAGLIVADDITNSDDCLIVTGFTSLAYVIDTFGYGLAPEKKVRIILGFEPDIYRRKKWKQVQIEQEIADYWLDRGINPAKCGAVLKTIERIKSGQIQFKALTGLHAKLYVTDQHAMLGSSNFSQSGLRRQHEANFRAPDILYLNEAQPYTDIRQIAENFWEQGFFYNEGMIGLLEQLLIIVSWQEALARAIAAVLEGQYLKEYEVLQTKASRIQLWPCQWTGIAQGMQILQQTGSLLIADPTGSGKTRMTAALQLALIQWLHALGKTDKSVPAIVAPPSVLAAWQDELLKLELSMHSPISQGILSHKTSGQHKTANKVLQMAHLLVMDEAHNYLAKGSNRSVMLAAHNAEFIMLSTATPINKRAKDLIRLVELLGPDNLGDDELKEFKMLYQKRLGEMDDTDLERLRTFIWKFTLRRTKSQLNRQIDEQPDEYRNELNANCRYPKQEYKSYSTGETTLDSEIAALILKEASELKGVIYLQTIEWPRYKKLKTLKDQEAYVNGRLAAVKGLAGYRVAATLRSSRAALVELIAGTKAATDFIEIKNLKKVTGNVVATLGEKKLRMPTYKFAKSTLPVWLREEAEYTKACEEEIAHYQEILNLVKRMSDSRERTKANFLAKLLKKHSLVLAFDHTVITLHYMHALLEDLGVTSYIGTGGEDKKGSAKIQKLFALGSKAEGIIGLCSDAMSEGINLQAANTVVMLDMPSILRLAEQRVGRIDRLDSPHATITSYWPEDSAIFALRADRNLYRTAELTRQMLGQNMALPLELTKRFADNPVVNLKEVFDDLRQSGVQSGVEGMQDAFKELYRLKDGPDALITKEEYASLAQSRASVRCKVSYVAAHSNWAFFALQGSKTEAPRWIFLDEAGNYANEFSYVCQHLRTHLSDVIATDPSEKDHEHFLSMLRKKERELLPHKRRRTLDVAENLLKRQLESVKQSMKNTRLEALIGELLKAFRYTADDELDIDWYAFAGQWMELLNPALKKLQEANVAKRKYYSLSDLDKKEHAPSFSEQVLQQILDTVPTIRPIEYRIAASIIGIREPQTETAYVN